MFINANKKSLKGNVMRLLEILEATVLVAIVVVVLAFGAKAFAAGTDAGAGADAGAKKPYNVTVSDGTDAGSYFGAAVTSINAITTLKVHNEGTWFNTNNAFIFVPAASDIAHIVHDFKNGNTLKPMTCKDDICTQNVFVTGVGKLHVVTIRTIFGVQIISPTEEVYDVVELKTGVKTIFVIKGLVVIRE